MGIWLIISAVGIAIGALALYEQHTGRKSD